MDRHLSGCATGTRTEPWLRALPLAAGTAPAHCQAQPGGAVEEDPAKSSRQARSLAAWGIRGWHWQVPQLSGQPLGWPGRGHCQWGSWSLAHHRPGTVRVRVGALPLAVAWDLAPSALPRLPVAPDPQLPLAQSRSLSAGVRLCAEAAGRGRLLPNRRLPTPSLPFAHHAHHFRRA